MSALRTPEQRLLDAIFGDDNRTLLIKLIEHGEVENIWRLVREGLLELRHPKTSALIPVSLEAAEALDAEGLHLEDLCWIMTDKGKRLLGVH